MLVHCVIGTATSIDYRSSHDRETFQIQTNGPIEVNETNKWSELSLGAIIYNAAEYTADFAYFLVRQINT